VSEHPAGYEVNLSRDMLESAARGILGGEPKDLSLVRLLHIITVTQYATDCLILELERRGEIDDEEGTPVIPYMSDHFVCNLLTRDNRP